MGQTIISQDNFGLHVSKKKITALVFMCMQYKSFETIVGKGETAHDEQFPLFHGVFYPFGKLSTIFIKFGTIACKVFVFWEKVNPYPHNTAF